MRDVTLPRRPVARLALAAVLSGVPAAGGAQGAREPYPGLDSYVEGALRSWQVPGAAIAIVRHDSLVYARGFGVRQVGTPDRVTERTIFAIGSSSKAFTAASVAMLVDEKKVNLDAPVSMYLPGFQLADVYASRELTVRDILTHRSGLARGELAWYGSAAGRDELVRRVRFLQPTWSFRSQFGYQNLMYLAAGQVVAHVADTTWDDFVQRRIFAPLGMASSSTTIRALAGQRDLATPHALVGDTVRAIAWRNIDNIGPAGSINSHVVDMAQWVRLQLGKGKYGGRQLISAKQMEEMHTPQTVIRLDSAARATNPETHLQAYGLGWFVEDYRGRLVVQHGGNIDGFTALVAMLPEEQLGLVILTNMNGTGLPTALMRKMFDLHLKAPPRDWSAELRARTETARERARAAQAKLEAERVPNTRPSLPLARYAGVYTDSLYGEVVVRNEQERLTLSLGPAWRGELAHWHFDTFRTRFDTPVLSPITVTFQLDPAAKPTELLIDYGTGPITFKRRPDSAGARSAAGGAGRP